MRTINTIVVHTTATLPGQQVNVQIIDGWHKDRGWSGIGYHWFIDIDGTISKGRDEGRIGAHVAGYNRESLGIVYAGGLDANGKPADTRTPAQKAALRSLIASKISQYDIVKVCGHRDLSPDLDGDGVIEPHEYIKACPCFDAIPEYADLLNNPNGTVASISAADALRIGSTGERVEQLQDILGLEITGLFDERTAAAVIGAKAMLGLYSSELVTPYVMSRILGAIEQLKKVA